MDRAIPVSNKLLQQRQKERDDELLFKKLKKIQNGHSEYNFRAKMPNIPQSGPKRKNNFIADLRDKEVHRENTILANKIRNTEMRSTACGSKILKV